MRKLFLAGISAFVLLGGLCTAEDNDEKIKAAIQAAQASLELIDQGKYSESWQQLPESYKSLVGEDQWVSAIKNARAPLGKMKSRKLVAQEYATNPPGAPAGEYVFVQFETVFENKTVVETAVPYLENGQWRNTTYGIR